MTSVDEDLIEPERRKMAQTRGIDIEMAKEPRVLTSQED